MGLERAKIIVLKDDGSSDTNKDDTIDVCFNPKEYSLEKSLQWDTEKSKTDAPTPEFKQPSAMTLSVTLQFDTYEERTSVRDKYTRRLEAAAHTRGKALGKKPTAEAKKNHMPPVILFVWGKFTFKGVIESLSQKYTMFLADGTPVRAEVGLKIKNVLTDEFDKGDMQKNAAGTTTRSVATKDGDRLDLIAAKELGDAGRWAEIAAMNNIDDPGAALPASLTIPSQ
jgi:nucleoid-associated protein YgaU